MDFKSKYNFKLIIILWTAVVSISSCSSGTWENDDKNWQRAFDTNLPKEIRLKHSYYWRSTHVFLEQEYFFEIEHTDSLEKEFLKGTDLVKVDSTNSVSIHFFGEKPKWFVPDGFQNYEIYKSSRFDNYYLFIDKQRKSIFLTDYQV